MKAYIYDNELEKIVIVAESEEQAREYLAFLRPTAVWADYKLEVVDTVRVVAF